MSEIPVRDEALEQYFESMKQLWNNLDFQLLLAEFDSQVQAINSIENASPSVQRTLSEETAFRQGQMNIIRTLQNLEDNIAVLESDYNASLEPQTHDSEDFQL